MDLQTRLLDEAFLFLAPTVGGAVLFALNNEDFLAGAGWGAVTGCSLIAGKSLLGWWLQNKPQTKAIRRPRTTFAYEMTYTSKRYLTRPLSDFFGGRKVDQLAPTQSIALEQWLYGSYTADLQPFIITDTDLWYVLRCVQRVPEVERNLSYRWLVRGRRVRRDLYYAFWNLLRYTEWYTGEHLIEQPRHQWYSLRTPASRVRTLFQIVEQRERGRGRGAPSMRRVPVDVMH